MNSHLNPFDSLFTKKFLDHHRTTDELTFTPIQWFPGHMKKTKELISKHLKYIDMLIEVLDARVPVTSQNPILEEILKKNQEKKKVTILNKIDLANKLETEQWVKKYTSKNNIVISLNSLQDNILKLINKACIEHFKKKKWFGKRAILGMVVGIPNVGKSTIINYLIRKKKTKVGNHPGITRSQQWIKINKNLELIDTPGLLWPKFTDPLYGIKLCLLGIIKEKLSTSDMILHYGIHLLIKKYPQTLMAKYNISLTYLNTNLEINEKNDFETNNTISEKLTYKVLEEIAKKKHLLKKNGEIDQRRAGIFFLKELRNGKLGKINLD